MATIIALVNINQYISVMQKYMYLGLVKFSVQQKFSAIMQVLTLRLDNCSQSYRHISAWHQVWRGWWSGRHQWPLPLGPPSTYWPAPWLLHCKPWCRGGGYQSGRLEWEGVLHEPIASRWQWVNPCLLVMIIVSYNQNFLTSSINRSVALPSHGTNALYIWSDFGSTRKGSHVIQYIR